jgi:capsular polysaccharide biosynthesis protein
MPIAIVDLDKLPVLDQVLPAPCRSPPLFLFPACSPAFEQVRLMSNTGILVGMHGAGFVNALFLPRGAVTVELFAGRYYSSVYGRYAAPGGVSAYSYHEPGVSSVTSSPQDQAAELAVLSFFFSSD